MQLEHALKNYASKGYKLVHKDGIEVATTLEKESVFISIVPSDVSDKCLQKVTVFLNGVYYVGGPSIDSPYLVNKELLTSILPPDNWELYTHERT